MNIYNNKFETTTFGAQWVCTKCGHNNPPNSPNCQGCGWRN